MKIIHNIDDMRKLVREYRDNKKSIGFVPTMGALHKGHMSLVESSKKDNDITVMSIYVNPTQFGPKEDLASYFRPIEQDKEMAQYYNVDVLFLPSDEIMYKTNETAFVTENTLSQILCGAYRPGHFQGVCTIVTKLLHIVSPHHIYLGQKDAQQLRILQKMVSELFFDVKVVPAQTIREDDGLACSSRNGYLHDEERLVAPSIYQSILLAKNAFEKGERRSEVLLSIVRSHLQKFPLVDVQYIEIVSWDNFEKIELIEKTTLLAVACFVGKTRLIDNIIFTP